MPDFDVVVSVVREISDFVATLWCPKMPVLAEILFPAFLRAPETFFAKITLNRLENHGVLE